MNKIEVYTKSGVHYTIEHTTMNSLYKVIKVLTVGGMFLIRPDYAIPVNDIMYIGAVE